MRESFEEGFERAAGVIQNAENGINFSEFFKDGKRIPLRGQEGMSVDQILAFERAGYKMSGYNKRQTEATYMKAERKVYTQEEKRMLEKHSLDDRKQKEKDKMEQFKNLAAQKFTTAVDKLQQNNS